ncbi:MAG TPA: cupin domain-containing protein [Verrucomicrobiae bacterium]|nr:cupin domain-containing protein [Verrucomicrobiae bacterium]
MTFKRLLGLLLVVPVLVGIAADRESHSGVIQIDHDRVAAVFNQGGLLVATNNFKVMALRRDAPGEVEIHDYDTDIFYIVEGTADFVTGGTAKQPHRTGPGEMRAGDLEGGQERKLVKGDVLIIPNGVPHWFKKVDGTFLYYVVKVAK